MKTKKLLIAATVAVVLASTPAMANGGKKGKNPEPAEQSLTQTVLSWFGISDS